MLIGDDTDFKLYISSVFFWLIMFYVSLIIRNAIKNDGRPTIYDWRLITELYEDKPIARFFEYFGYVGFIFVFFVYYVSTILIDLVI